MVVLETDRLVLRALSAEDFEDYAAMFADPNVVRYIGSGKPLSRFSAWQNMAAAIGHWHLRGYGMWAIADRVTDELIGRVGFLNAEGWPGFELGWTLRFQYWGHGYATEGAIAALDYAFDQLDRDHVISLIHPSNVRSIALAKRLGEQLEGMTSVFDQEVFVYGITRNMWKDIQE